MKLSKKEAASEVLQPAVVLQLAGVSATSIDHMMPLKDTEGHTGLECDLRGFSCKAVQGLAAHRGSSKCRERRLAQQDKSLACRQHKRNHEGQCTDRPERGCSSLTVDSEMNDADSGLSATA